MLVVVKSQNETAISSDGWFNYFKNLLNMPTNNTGSKNVVLSLMIDKF